MDTAITKEMYKDKIAYKIRKKENEKSKQVFNEKDEQKNTKHSLDLSEDKLKEDLVKILDVSIETIEID